MDPIPRTEEELFAAVLTQPAEARAAFLIKICAGDVTLRRRLEALISAEAASGDFLEHPAIVRPFRDHLPREAICASEIPGDRIDRYRLLRKIGEGGCGIVYLAEQEEPIRRQVALKVIKLGMDTKEVIARFESERQALARMDHPNVAKVFDGGATDTGRPFFVMELVHGVKITDYCDQEKLSTAERLRLFVQVCHAIQHAHQKGIIHRDIKPSNILVTLQDGAATPKVIDFGIAKATQGRLTDRTVFTALEQFVGTPAYMSPEQAALSNQDVDTRSDIYSLGVLLYELLTGRTPFDASEFAKAGLDEMRRQIRDVDPPTPSTVLSTLDAAAITTAAQRRSAPPPRLLHQIRGDLDWIVMRCLEKDRRRRYDTARSLADDLERHVRHEPIEARPPLPGYLLRKLIRRHRRMFVAAAIVFVGLALAAIASTAFAVRAIRAERKSAEAVQVFRRMLADIGPTVSLHPKSGLDRDGAKWREILDRVAVQIPRELADHPDLAAEVFHVFGKIYLASGDRPRAEAMFRSALVLQRAHPPADPLEFAQTNYDLGLALIMQGHSNEAGGLLRQALEVRRSVLGTEHPETVRTLEDLGFCLWAEGEHLQAEPVLREAVAIRRKCGTIEQFDNPDRSPLWGLAICLSFLGRFDQAELLSRENLASVKRLCESHHPFVRSAHELLGDCLARRGNFIEALPQWRAALEIDRATLPADHPMLVFSTYGVANCLDQLGDLDGAEPLYRESLKLWRQRIHIEDREIILRLDGLAGLLVKRGSFTESQQLLDESWDLLNQPAHAEWLDFWPEVIRGQIELFTAWARVDSAREPAIGIWNSRLQEFERSAVARPPGRDRLNSLRGLANAYRSWATADRMRADRFALWQRLLRECWENPPPVKLKTGS